MKLFSVFDEKMERFASPFMAVAEGQAARMFGDLVLEAGHPFEKHPADYKLYLVGVMDELSGELVSQVPPKLIAVGSAFVPADPSARTPLAPASSVAVAQMRKAVRDA